MTNITIRDVSVKPDITAPTAEITAATFIRNTVYAVVAGSADEWTTPEQYLQEFTGTTQRHQLWLVEADDAPVGIARLDTPLDTGAETTHGEVLILPDWQSQGIGSRCMDILLAEARALGRKTMAGWAEHPSDLSVPQLAAPTGFGAIPNDHIARFLTRHGFALEQVDRKSIFNLAGDLDEVEEHLVRAEGASSGYEVLQWIGTTPPDHLTGMARLRSRMSTDAPSAGLDQAAEDWDAARVIQNDARVAAGGVLRQTTVARHIASGELVAYNVLSRLRDDPDGATEQGDTLVHAEHRGHRLGMLVKCRGLLSWHREHSPRSPRVLTWNAEENRPMLDINEALGFVPAGYIGAWQTVL